MKDFMMDFIHDESGATMVEYAIMVALIAIVSIVTVTALGGSVNDTFNTVQGCLADPSTCPGG